MVVAFEHALVRHFETIPLQKHPTADLVAMRIVRMPAADSLHDLRRQPSSQVVAKHLSIISGRVDHDEVIEQSVQLVLQTIAGLTDVGFDHELVQSIELERVASPVPGPAKELIQIDLPT